MAHETGLTSARVVLQLYFRDLRRVCRMGASRVHMGVLCTMGLDLARRPVDVQCTRDTATSRRDELVRRSVVCPWPDGRHNHISQASTRGAACMRSHWIGARREGAEDSVTLCSLRHTATSCLLIMCTFGCAHVHSAFESSLQKFRDAARYIVRDMESYRFWSNPDNPDEMEIRCARKFRAQRDRLGPGWAEEVCVTVLPKDRLMTDWKVAVSDARRVGTVHGQEVFVYELNVGRNDDCLWMALADQQYKVVATSEGLLHRALERSGSIEEALDRSLVQQLGVHRGHTVVRRYDRDAGSDCLSPWHAEHRADWQGARMQGFVASIDNRGDDRTLSFRMLVRAEDPVLVGRFFRTLMLYVPDRDVEEWMVAASAPGVVELRARMKEVEPAIQGLLTDMLFGYNWNWPVWPIEPRGTSAARANSPQVGAFNPVGATRTLHEPSSPTYWDRQPRSAPWTPK